MSIRSNTHLLQLIRRASTKPTTNGEINPFVYNRNPRNLERLRLEYKPTGFPLDKKFVNYWHKLEINVHPKYIDAKIIHNNGNVVVEASTKEWCIRKFLYSPKDKQAYIVLAQVFAQRCLESGITCFHSEKVNADEKPNLSTFLQILRDEELILEEPEVFNIYDIWRKKREKKPWTVLES